MKRSVVSSVLLHRRCLIGAIVVLLSMHQAVYADAYEYLDDTESDELTSAPATSAPTANNTLYDFDGSGVVHSSATYLWLPDDEFDMPDSRRARQTIICTTESLSASGTGGSARARNTFYGMNTYTTGLEEVQNGVPDSYRATSPLDDIAAENASSYPQWDDDLDIWYLDLSTSLEATNYCEVVIENHPNTLAASNGESTIQTMENSVRPYPL